MISGGGYYYVLIPLNAATLIRPVRRRSPDAGSGTGVGLPPMGPL
jgi:hypothetical protein